MSDTILLILWPLNFILISYCQYLIMKKLTAQHNDLMVLYEGVTRLSDAVFILITKIKHKDKD